MHIYLESFIDTNFGDDLFVHIVASKYKKHTFYMIVREGFEESYKKLSEHVKNIKLITKEDGEEFLYQMDAMLVVGGDMFGDNTDYGVLQARARAVKSTGAFVGFFGISLFPEYSPETLKELTTLFEIIDVIVVREQETYCQIKENMPNVNVMAAADIAFSTNVDKYLGKKSEKGLLGISVREKAVKNAPDAHLQYCKGMAEVAAKYLQQDENNKVVLLALSSGRFDDVAVAEKIMELCPIKNPDRIWCVPFGGDIEKYIEIMQMCERMICTRFHALVFAILLKKKFVPVVYEEKTKRLLKELGYTGIMPVYGENMDAEEVLASFADNKYSDEKLMVYKKKASHVFDRVDKFIVERMIFKVKRKIKKFFRV